MSTKAATIEVVRGDLDDERAERILAFWREGGALHGEAARQRLDQVVCVALDDRGGIVAANSAFEASIQLVGRRFWVYRSLIPGGDGELRSAMFNAAFDALGHDFDPDGPGPVGLCVIGSDPGEMERRPDAVWPDEQLLFAGYLDDGRQLRIRYFWNAKIGPGPADSPPLEATMNETYPIGDRFQVLPLRESGATADDLLSLWARETDMPEAEAQRRVQEAELVAIERDEGLVAISTAFVRPEPRLRMIFWHCRAFVAEAHRHSNLAGRLGIELCDLLERRFIEGEDTRAPGMIFEVENEGLRAYFNRALWLPLDFHFVGERDRGAHVRVHYFPGARVPLPEQSVD